MNSAAVEQPGRSTSGRIVGLDGLRAVSILFVLIGHGRATAPGGSAELAVLGPYLGNGHLGVTTFFVISGYLITHLLRREWEQVGAIRLRVFYARRVLRIFPALYTYLLVLTLLRTLEWVNTTRDDVVVAAVFLTNYKILLPVVTNDDYWFVGHFWTLSLEEQFYLFWPTTIFLFGFARAPRIALLIVFAAPLVRIATYFAWPSVRGQLGMMLHTAADPIMIGCLAALWQGRTWFERLLCKGAFWIWPLAAACFLVVGSPSLSLHFRGSYLMTVGLTLDSVAVAFILLWIVEHPNSFAGRLLSTPVFRHVGVLSYSLYLWQQLFLTTRNQTWTGLFPINFLACFAAAEASYWIIERPFLQLRSLFRRKIAARADSGSTSIQAGSSVISD
jgi:peptidoglycan/LPS O-acetylase OafA/YrhL